jgi:hypothetical protein
VRIYEFTPNNRLIVAPVSEDRRAQCIRPHGAAHWVYGALFDADKLDNIAGSEN